MLNKERPPKNAIDVKLELPINSAVDVPNSVIMRKIVELKDLFEENRDYVILEKIDREKSNEIMMANEFGNLKMRHENGNLILTKQTPRAPHECAGATIIKELILNGMEGRVTGRTLFSCERFSKEPDESFRPRSRNTKGPYSKTGQYTQEFPTLVVEIAFCNESEAKLIQLLENWISKDTTVNVAIGLKIGCDEKEDKTRTLNFHYYLRSNPNYHIKRDLNKCTNDNAILNIPIADLYDGSVIPTELISKTHLQLNLLKIRTEIYEILREENSCFFFK